MILNRFTLLMMAACTILLAPHKGRCSHRTIDIIDLEENERIAMAECQAEHEMYQEAWAQEEGDYDCLEDNRCDGLSSNVCDSKSGETIKSDEQIKVRIKSIDDKRKELDRLESDLLKKVTLSQNELEECRPLIRKYLYPSQVLLELAKQQPDNDRKVEIMTLLSTINDYDFYDLNRYGFVAHDAKKFLFNYYINLYNARVKNLKKIQSFDKECHSILQRACNNIYDHPLMNYDDTDSLFYIANDIKKTLKNFLLWYVNHQPVYKILGDEEFLHLDRLMALFTMGAQILSCTHYGIKDAPYDLHYFLKQKDFQVFKSVMGTYSQHHWVHKKNPLQIRIKNNGQVTAGILEKNPYEPKSASWELSLLEYESDNEVYKVASHTKPEDAEPLGHVIPARHLTNNSREKKKPRYKETRGWYDKNDQESHGKVMDKAHVTLCQKNIAFQKVDQLENPPSIP